MSEAVTEVSFEQAMQAALATIEQPAAAPEQSADSGQPPQPDTAAATPAVATPEPPSQAQLERAAALEAREAKAREREEATTRREAAVAAAEAKSAKQWEAFEANPVAHIKSMRPDLSPAQAAKIAERLYFHAMGDNAPPQYRQQQEVADVRDDVQKTVAELRAELETERARAAQVQQQSQIQAYQAELRAGAETAADAPIVASLAKRNPERAAQMLFEVARRAAVESAQRGAAEPVVLTPAQAAAQLESILKAQRDELYGPPVAVVTAPNAQQAAPSPTITNRDASIQPSRTVPDPLDDKTLRIAALAAAGIDIPAWD